ncbi:MAG: ATP-binding protein [Methanobrevibacter sp.]|jgi:predicted ATPase|nr:ATP-binding protein [Candidatus Methanovirga meridionalis]
MKENTLEIENFGEINQAKIDINKINVVGGINGSGKTTASKVLYSFLVSDSNDADAIYLKELIKSLNELYDNIYHIKRFKNENMKTYYTDTFPQLMLIRAFCKNVSLLSDLNDENFHNYKQHFRYGGRKMLENFENYSFIDLEKKFLENLKNLKHEVLSSKNLIDSISYVIDLFKALENNENQNEKIFCLALYNEFAEDESFFKNNENSKLKFIDKKEKLNNEKKKYFNGIEIDFNTETVINDIFYMETPSLLDFSDPNNISIYRSYKNKFSYPQEFLIKKLYSENNSNPILKEESDDKNLDPLQLINNVIKGHFYSEEKINKEIRFKYGENASHIKNTASGVKDIGILQLLLEKGVDSNSCIIIDEPEVHLHPEWQVALAEIIVVLSKFEDITFYINTHSPLFIEAISTYGLYHKMNEDVSFFLSEKDETKGYNIIQVDNNDTKKTFKHLNKGYEILDKVTGEMHANDILKR